jgi:hypothetical protein
MGGVCRFGVDGLFDQRRNCFWVARVAIRRAALRCLSDQNIEQTIEQEAKDAMITLSTTESAEWARNTSDGTKDKGNED